MLENDVKDAKKALVFLPMQFRCKSVVPPFQVRFSFASNPFQVCSLEWEKKGSSKGGRREAEGRQ